MLSTRFHRLCCFSLLALTLIIAGCGGKRSEPVATVDGTVTFDGKSVPDGRIIFEDKAKGVRMMFPISGGKFTINDTAKLPAGTYAVAVAPPAEAAPEGDYDKMMGGASATQPKAAKKVDYIVPEKFHDTKTSGKSVELKEGSQTVEVAFSK